ncbi:hypothetical protein F5Y15DRAFT_127885 [Xylariaceae sp. FL0016]|nr:hypothetical protein F5Y15DRAFT_127885 [Xylariaceae sp. FL0016]
MHSTLSNSNHFLDLPRELLNAVFAYLTPLELVATTLVSRAFYNLANDDIHWQKHVLSNLPARKMSSPTPCRTWRELYIAHDPYWFLPKHKVWFCDRELTGQMVICRYDERRGCIEGYQLLAVRSRDGSEPWLADHNVHIHYFDPQVKLHIDKPILQFNVDSIENRLRNMSTGHPRSTGHFSPEQVIRYSRGSDPRFSNFMLAKPLAESLVNMLSTRDFPYDYVWPPPQIPAKHRVLSQPAGIGGRRPRHMALSPENNATSSPTSLWQPSARSETSDQTFRIRQWMEMGPPALGVRIGEEIVTYSTLDPKLYTPTPEKPWKGIWVGDYSGHGCEFLLMNQPDTEDQDNEAPLRRHVDESDETFQKRFMDERVYRGRLEAIKLTGDPNVPRGEYTFIVEDLGEGGFMGITQEPPFQGTRVVRSKGHIAHAGFFHDKYIESQLILISQNRLAQYWKDFGHISFFERVDIDQFLVPKGPCF